MANDDFTYLLRVRYAECDAQLVVFNAKYLEYVDVAWTEFMRHTVGSYDALMASGLDMQVVSARLDWVAPARFDDVVAVQLRAERLGNTSLTLGFRFLRHADKSELASGTITYVLVEIPAYRKVTISDDLRGKLEQGGKGAIVDHAGASSKSH